MSDNNNFMVINLATAECELGFATIEQAKQFIKATGIPEYTQADCFNAKGITSPNNLYSPFSI